MFCGPFNAFGSRMVLLTHSIHRRTEPYAVCDRRDDSNTLIRNGGPARGGVYLSPDEVKTIVRLVQEHRLVSR